MNFLEQMATQSAARVRAARAMRSEAGLLAACKTAPAPPPLRLGRFDLIAEIKRNSPSEGALGPNADVATRALGYAAGGAAVVSVLTEPAGFGGSLEDLGSAAGALHARQVPAMRKDFLVDPWQVLEARAAGAGGVLLIAAMLTDGALREMLDTAREQGLFVLLEAFDEADLARAAACPPPGPGEPPLLIGVNSRDLRTLAVDVARLARLAPRLPPGMPAVAESGLGDTTAAAEVAALGYRLALVGTALMRTSQPEALAAAMLAAGRRAALAEAG